MEELRQIYLLIIMAPLLGVLSGGLKFFPKNFTHSLAIIGIGISFLLSIYVFYQHQKLGLPPQNIHLYHWLVLPGFFEFQIGFLIDYLTIIMMLVVTSISLLVHIYSIGYMKDDPGYQRFFAYISLFTFAMLALVMSNNFLQLFFGWEAVGLASYLLIGFWFKRPSAIDANLKAFLVNRVGDLGMLLGIALIFYCFGSLNYTNVFDQIHSHFSNQVLLLNLMGFLLFVGAMGKSAQIPLHIWLPDSMEGPTPISALIHAATMVTAGIFMVARMSPIFEYAQMVSMLILFVGALTAFLMGWVGLVQNDIKRVIAYSTLSQLGYMTAALGVSAYSVAIFHLVTHAFFKALLFLGAGAIIVSMHHVQDMRRFGGLFKRLPVVSWCMIFAAMALSGVPGFSGFFSKDLILYAVKNSHLPFSNIAYYLLLISVLTTALYSTRLILMTFFGPPKDQELLGHFHRPNWSIQLPLIFLLVPSVLIGVVLFEPLILKNQLSEAIFVAPTNHFLITIQQTYNNAQAFMMHGFLSLPNALVLIGFLLSMLFFWYKKSWLERVSNFFPGVQKILSSAYGFDQLIAFVFIKGAQKVSLIFAWIDQKIIDKFLVMSWSYLIGKFSRVFSNIQSGYIGDYALISIGVCLLFIMFIFI